MNIAEWTGGQKGKTVTARQATDQVNNAWGEKNGA